jgi:mannan endo-1,4-beta-mannosidase
VKRSGIAAVTAAVVAGAAIAVTAGLHFQTTASRSAVAAPRAVSATLPATPESYLGVYLPGVPDSYASVPAFTKETGVKPDVLTYYSGWREGFHSGFAVTAAKQGAVPLVQIDPQGISLAAIASGQYDVDYLDGYAADVKTYGLPVIIGFGHEMNGSWESWGYGHTSPAEFVAAWRHIVTLFRNVGADNVTWLWTVNVIEKQAGIPSPAPWWPGSAYVTWVGIDGYYATSSMTFAGLFGPTIVAVRSLTKDPVIVAETGATSGASQPGRIADLFAGVRSFGLLGFAWFDAVGKQDWQLTAPAAAAALRNGAAAYHGVGS